MTRRSAEVALQYAYKLRKAADVTGSEELRVLAGNAVWLVERRVAAAQTSLVVPAANVEEQF